MELLEKKIRILGKLVILGFLVLSVNPAVVQAAGADDFTGTDPLDFKNDLRIHYNFSSLNTINDGELHTTTLEYSHPFFNDTWEFRIRARQISKDIDLTQNGVVDIIDETGPGNTDIRVLTAPYTNEDWNFTLAAGLEVYIDTANNAYIAESSTSLAPEAIAVFYNPPGGGALVAPSYQHVFNIAGKSASRSEIDLLYLYTWPEKFLNWASITPQVIIDYDNDSNSFWSVDVEAGKMLTKHQSLYIRPGWGIGARTFDWNIETGWQLVW